VEPTPVGASRTHLRRPFLVAAVVLIVIGLAFAVVVRDNGHTPSTSPPRPVTLDAALAAFGGATDLYLKIFGIDGGSTNQRHAKEIDIADVSWQLTNANATPAAATLGAVTVTKGVDVASPKLLVAAAAGTPLFGATISADKPAGFTFVKLNLLNVRVSSIAQTANRTSGFDEKITLTAAVIQLIYTVQNPDGSKGPDVSGCWNLATHAAC
jgi:type VI secretion system secreted protein Hcp